MASTVVGTLRVLLEANAAKLESEFEKATIKIGAFDKFTQNAGRNLTRMVEQFSGQKIVTEAAKMAAAVERVGGVSTLTERELRRVSSTVEEATAKLRAMGAEVPPSIAKLSTEIGALGTKATTASGALGTGAGGLAGAMKLLGPLLPIASIAGLTTAVIRMGKSAFDSAGQILDLSSKTGLSTTAIQQMQAVANQTGTSLEAFTNSATTLGVNIANGTDKAREAVKELGLSFVQLAAMKPEEQFKAVIAALEEEENVGKRNAMGRALFGKQWDEIAAGIVQGYSDIANAATLSTDEQLKALDKASDAWQKFVDDTLTRTTSILGSFVLVLQKLAELKAADAFKEGLERSDRGGLPTGPARSVDIPFKSQAQDVRDYVKELMALNSALAALTPAQKEQLDAAIKLEGVSEKLADQFGLTEAGLRLYQAQIKSTNKSLEDADNFQAAWSDSQAKFQVEMKKSTAALLEFIEKGVVKSLTKADDSVKSAERLTKPLADALIKNAKLHKSHEIELDKLIREKTLSRVGFQISEIDRWADNEKAELDRNAQNWRDHVADIERIAEIRRQAIIDEDMARQLVIFANEEIAVRERQRKANLALGNSLRDLAQAFSQLAQIAGEGGLGRILQTTANLIGTMNLAFTAGNNLKEGLREIAENGGGAAAKFTLMAANIGAYTAAMAQAVNTTNRFQAALGGFSATSSFASGLGLTGMASVSAGVIGGVIGIAFAMEKARAEKARYRDALFAVKKEFLGLFNEMSGVRAAFPALSKEWADLFNVPLNEDVLKRMAAIVDKIKEKVGETNDEFADLASRMIDAGFKIPSAFQPVIQQLVTLGVLSKENASLFAQLTDGTVVDWRKMEEAAGRYGDWLKTQLGPAFDQLKITDRAKQIVNDFDLMKRGGAEVGSILMGMQDELVALIQDAIRTGAKLPANMRPWIDELERAGLLVDENGDKLWDLGALQFAEPIKTEFEILTEALQAFIDKLDLVISKFTELGNVKLPNLTPDGSAPPPGGNSTNPGGSRTGPVPLAAGAIVSRPTLALIGERGPEIVAPLSALSRLPDFAYSGPGEVIGRFDEKRSQSGEDIAERIVEGINRHMDRVLATFDETMRIGLRDAIAGVV